MVIPAKWTWALNALCLLQVGDPQHEVLRHHSLVGGIDPVEGDAELLTQDQSGREAKAGRSYLASGPSRAREPDQPGELGWVGGWHDCTSEEPQAPPNLWKCVGINVLHGSGPQSKSGEISRLWFSDQIHRALQTSLQT